jgi:hypothetical protein
MTDAPIYKQKLCSESENKRLIRTIRIELGPDDHPGYVVRTSNLKTTGDDFSSRSIPERDHREWFRTKEDAFDRANGLVESSKKEGMTPCSYTNRPE